MQVYEQITPAEQELEQEKEVQRAPRAAPSGGLCLTLLQAAVCALILIAALLLRTLLPPLYDELRAWYDGEMNQSIILTADDVSYS
ncbi:MAG: hypothetical protein ACI4GO_00310 [Hominenteromicrobium sp.]